MIYEETKDSIFKESIVNDYHLVHCISFDLAMGQGIALEFDHRFKLKRELYKIRNISNILHNAILINRVFNLVTKNNCTDKPTYQSILLSLLNLRHKCLVYGIFKLAMPRIASGLDKLKWEKVSSIIKEVFKDTGVSILICLGEEGCVKSTPLNYRIPEAVESISQLY